MKKEDISINGCGPRPWNRFIPDFIFKPCCNVHDANFSTKGVKTHDANMIFLNSCVNRVFKHKKHKWFYLAVGLFYSYCVLLWGKNFRKE